MPLITGMRLGPYEIHSPLGTGGMGEVYRAKDLRLGREVAIKVLPQELAADREALDRFEREAKAVAALSHPNVLAIFGFGAEGGITFAVTELLEGETLRQYLAQGAIPWRKAVAILLELSEGLYAVHAKGIVHRDLKPENVFLTAGGHVKILDFGLATGRAEEDAARRERHANDQTDTTPLPTAPSPIFGTLGYMSPEQLRGGDVTPQSDIFSLGCLLFEMVTGKRPFFRNTPVDTMAAVLAEAPDEIDEIAPGVPPELSRVIHHCLEKDPQRRFHSARDLAYALEELNQKQTAPFKVTPAQAPRRKRGHDSLAVLPFENTSGDAGLDYLAEGITETLIGTLTQIPKLKVMARSTVFRYRGKSVDPREAGRDLNVGAVLTGRVATRGQTLDVRAELVDVANGWQLWGEKYERRLDDIFHIQDEIAERISDALKVKLSGEQKKKLAKRHTTSSEAYQLYLKGRHHWNKRTPDGFRRAMDLYASAIDKDPRYALAYSGVADCYDVLGNFSLIPPDQAYPRAKEAAQRAIEIDEGLAEGHVSLAFAELYYDWDFPGAEARFRRALALNPGYAVAHQWYSIALSVDGRFEESLQQARQALELDPLSLPTNMTVGWMLYLARRYDEAIEQLGRTHDIDPNFMASHFFLGMAHLARNEMDVAAKELARAGELSGRNPRVLGGLGYLAGRTGDRASAGAILEELEAMRARTYVPAYEFAVVHTGLGDAEQALHWLEEAFAERGGWLIFIDVEPIFDSLRADPRFLDLVRRIGLGKRR